MGRCGSCARELAPAWRFCVYCGRALPREEHPLGIRHGPDGPDDIPAAIRPDPQSREVRTHAAGLWAGAVLGVLGLGVIVVAAVQIFFSHV